MPLHRSTVWKRRHSSKTKSIIHKANIPRLSLLLQSSNPQPNTGAELLVGKIISPSDERTSTRAPPEWSPITPLPRICTWQPGTSTSNNAPMWSPITPQARPLAPPPPTNVSAQLPPTASLPAAAPKLTKLAIIPGTAVNKTTASQQMLVKIYGEAAFNSSSLADWEKYISVDLPFEELPVHSAITGLTQLPGLRALGLDVLYEVGQMDSFAWRVKLFGPQYGRAEVAEGSESVGSVEDAKRSGVGDASHVREEEDESEDVFAGSDVTKMWI